MCSTVGNLGSRVEIPIEDLGGGRYREIAQPVQIGPIQVGVARDISGGDQKMFNQWSLELFARLPGALIAHLVKSHTPALFKDGQQGRLRVLLQRHLPSHLQHMICSMLHEDGVMILRRGRGGCVSTEIEGLSKDLYEQYRQYRQIQTFLQETLSEIIQDELLQLPSEPLLTLLQDSIPQGCDEAALQDTFQRQIQDRLPSLRQNLLRSVRQKLLKDFDELRKEDLLQNLLQNRLQHQLHNRLQDLHLGQLKNVFCALRQSLLDKQEWPGDFGVFDFSIWVQNLCKDRFQQLLQGDSGCFSQLFEDICPPDWRVYFLRDDLALDLLLDTLLSLLELKEVLPQIDAPPEPRLVEDRLPNLYETLYRTLFCDMIIGLEEEGAGREAVLETLRKALERSLNLEGPSSEPAPNQGAALAAG